MKLDLEYFTIKKPKESNVNVETLSDFEKILEKHGGSTIVEHKYDGNGIIIDARLDDVSLYSLNKLSWNPDCLPELKNDLKNLPRGFYVGELVGKPTFEGFTGSDEFFAVRVRPKQNFSSEIQELQTSNPLEIRLYDILEFQGEILAHQSRQKMCSYLQQLTDFENIHPVKGQLVDDARHFQEITQEQFLAGKEGFVVKNPSSSYSKLSDFVKGGRTADWLKIKKSVTFDYAVLGLYQTPERLSQGWACSNVLLGSYNKESGKFETISKLTISRKDQANELFEMLAPHCDYSWSEDQPYYWQNDASPKWSDEVDYSERLQRARPKNKVPFMYLKNPTLHAPIMEVNAMEFTNSKNPLHSCGKDYGNPYSLRIPRFVRMRDDKDPLDATTTQQIVEYVNKF